MVTHGHLLYSVYACYLLSGHTSDVVDVPRQCAHKSNAEPCLNTARRARWRIVHAHAVDTGVRLFTQGDIQNSQQEHVGKGSIVIKGRVSHSSIKCT
jgi:hypothetical protein